ncbi:MAG: ADP compounds hydrolase NudE [Gammaproteobacteria bacterium]|nr:ADP compounds hydrolase NudE [Gammaproteobacteria bacterium]
MKTKPKIIQRSSVAQSRLFKIEALQLKFSNEVECHYEVIAGKSMGSVMIVPMLDDNTLLLIREYAAGVDDYVLGFPKGAIAKDEDILMTANRELMEEVGYGAHTLEPVTEFSLSPGYFTSKMALILARDLYPQRIAGDEPEQIEVVPWALNNIDKLLAQADFHEGRSIAALLLIERRLRGHN